MTDTPQHECEAGCGRPAPTTRICWTCTTHITDSLGLVTQKHMGILAAIARREEEPFTLVTWSTTRQSYGPSEPMDLTALSLHQDLTRWKDMSASDWSQTDRGDLMVQLVPDCVGRVLNMVDGEEEPVPTADYVKGQIREHVRPMPTRLLVPWLAEIGIRVTASQIGTWAHRGKISRVDSGPGHPWYSPVDVVRVLHQNSH